MKPVQKTFLEGTFMCTPSLLMCVHLRPVCVHSLEGTLLSSAETSKCSA